VHERVVAVDLGVTWDPNAPAVLQVNGHRLYPKGLSTVQWAGMVIDSELIAQLEKQSTALNRVRRILRSAADTRECVRKRAANRMFRVSSR